MTSLLIAPSRAAVAGHPSMAVLAIVSRKGGAGKTTLAINLAVAATAGGRRVSILDTDPQASALAWSDCRHDPWPRVSPCPAHRIARALQDAAAEGIGLAIVDTAPHAEGAALAAARAADLVVVPCRPALFDLHAVAAALDIAGLAAVPAAVVLNAVPARGQTAAEARAVLGGVDVLPERLGQRAAFVRALTAGEGVVEHEPRGKATAYPRRSLPVQLAQIRVADRLRLALDEATVVTIAGSMAELGQQLPVLLRPWRAAGAEGSDAWGREDAGLFALVAGAHRLEAARRLGWAHIEALIVEGTPDEVRLIEIDENLAWVELTVLDRARFLATRKRINLRLHPERRRGGDRKSVDCKEENLTAKFAVRSFADEVGASAGLSERAVRRAVDIGEKLDDQAAADLAGTGLADREGDLHALSRMPASKQRVIAAICRDAPRGATLGKALAALEGRGKRAKTTTGGRTPVGAGLAALQRA